MFFLSCLLGLCSPISGPKFLNSSLAWAMPARRRRRGNPGYRGLPSDMWGNYGAAPPHWLVRSSRKGGRGSVVVDDESEYSYGGESSYSSGDDEMLGLMLSDWGHAIASCKSTCYHNDNGMMELNQLQLSLWILSWCKKTSALDFINAYPPTHWSQSILATCVSQGKRPNRAEGHRKKRRAIGRKGTRKRRKSMARKTRRMIRKKKTEGQWFRPRWWVATALWHGLGLITFISQWLAWHTFNVGNVAIIVSALYQNTIHCQPHDSSG